MKISLLIAFLLFLVHGMTQPYAKCKIFTDDTGLHQLSKAGIPVDHGTLKKGSFFISDFSPREMELIKELGFNYEIVIPDVQQFYQERNVMQSEKRNASCLSDQVKLPPVPSGFNLGSMAGFYTYQEFLDELDEMAATYPNLISARQTISTFLTHENRPIYWLKISDNPSVDEAEPEVLYSALHHAREPLSLSNTIFYMWYLLENYATDPEVKYLVDETELYFIPMLNPDGYVQNQTSNPNGGGMWRKNKRDNGDGTIGVDLNRNYSAAWGTTGVNFDGNSDTYPGKSAFSEPETQAMKWFCENHQIQFAFNAHTYSNLILFPIGATSNDFADDHDYFQSLGDHMVRDNHFVAQKASDLYPASGDSDDYMYLDDLDKKPAIFAFTPEIGSDNDGFWPASSSITLQCQLMVQSNLALAHAPHNYWLVTENEAFYISEKAGNFEHQVKRLGLNETDLIVSISPLKGIKSFGSPLTYDLALNQSEIGHISYILEDNIQVGDPVEYVLHSDFGSLQVHDTIRRSYGEPPVLFFDPVAVDSNWVGDWGTTNATFASPSLSYTDSPNGTYKNFTFKQIRLKNSINLLDAKKAELAFYAKWDIESDFDYARLEVSTDNGLSWIGQCGKYTVAGTSVAGGVQPNNEPVYEGKQSEWVLEEMDLSDYLGQNIDIRFVLRSDGGLVKDGFYFDDFKVYMDDGKQLSAAQPFKIFPSPASGKLYVQFPTSLKGFQLTLYDQHGRKVSQKQIQQEVYQDQLDIQKLRSGIYTADLISADQVHYRVKIMIQQ